ncbi:MAG: hypothetical protein PHU23_14330 [Dehalococcoidales bacterium]|nr:hypothetical protein [Dehalococcoidales bacterium]
MINKPNNSPITLETIELHLRRIDKHLTAEKIATNKALFLWPIGLAASISLNGALIYPNTTSYGFFVFGAILFGWTFYEYVKYSRKFNHIKSE